MVHSEFHAHSGEHSRTECFIAIRDYYLCREGVSARVDRRVDFVDGSGELLVRQGIGGYLYLIAFLHLGVVGLGNAYEQLHRSNLFNHKNRLAGIHVPFIVIPCGHHSVKRRAKHSVLKQILIRPPADVVSHFCSVIIRLGDPALQVKALKTAKLRRIVLKLHPGLV